MNLHSWIMMKRDEEVKPKACNECLRFSIMLPCGSKVAYSNMEPRRAPVRQTYPSHLSTYPVEGVE